MTRIDDIKRRAEAATEENWDRKGAANEIWKLLWPYIADENADESFSEEMAQRLCENVLPTVWNKILALEKANAKFVDEDIPWLVECVERLEKALERLQDHHCSGVCDSVPEENHMDVMNMVSGALGMLDG